MHIFLTGPVMTPFFIVSHNQLEGALGVAYNVLAKCVWPQIYSKPPLNYRLLSKIFKNINWIHTVLHFRTTT